MCVLSVVSAGWRGQAPLAYDEATRSFRASIPLPPGVHQFKYIVDGTWLAAPGQPTATDAGGNGECSSTGVRRRARSASPVARCAALLATAVNNVVTVAAQRIVAYDDDGDDGVGEAAGARAGAGAGTA